MLIGTLLMSIPELDSFKEIMPSVALLSSLFAMGAGYIWLAYAIGEIKATIILGIVVAPYLIYLYIKQLK